MPTQRFATTGAAETVDFLTSAYGRVSTSSWSETSSLRVERDLAGELTLDRVGFGLQATFEVDPLDSISVFRLRSGRVRFDRGGNEFDAATGDLCVTPQRPYAVDVLEVEEDVVQLPWSVLSDVADTRGPDRGRIELAGPQPVSMEAAANFNRIYAFVRRSLGDLPTGAGEDATQLVLGSLTRLVAAGLLTTFPNNAVTESTSADRHDAHPSTLRRAIAFIEANPDLDLSVADVAHASHVSVRAVQLAFRRHLDTTPLAYLRRVRLDRAHDDLQIAVTGDGSTVTQIAARWGYARPSRFAAHYRAAYHRHPSETLRDD